MNIRTICIILFPVILFMCKSQEISQSNTQQESLPDTISVAFYNLENLFDAHFNGNEYTEYNPATSNWDQKMFLQKVQNTADVIIAMNPGIIGLCEVENSTALNTLQKELSKRGQHFKYSAIADYPLKTNTCVALLSKYPLKNVTSMEVRLQNGSITRNILEADIRYKCSSIKVFVNHWPSKSHHEESRNDAAKVLVQRINQLPPSTEYILLGDFNSNYDEFMNVKNTRKKVKSAINYYLQTIQTDSFHNSTFTDEQTLRSGGKGHYDLWLELPPNLRMSESFNGYNQTLDHILLPSSLLDNKDLSYVDNSFTVFTWNKKLLKANVPYRWELRRIGRKKEHSGKGYSDHLPITARFTCSPFRDLAEKYTKTNLTHDGTILQKTTESNLPSQWTSCNNSVKLTNDTLMNRGKGLSIRCETMTSNCSIARKGINTSKPFITFLVKGSGKFSFRIRTQGNDWVYYNAPDFKDTKVAHYSDANYPEWEKVQLRIKKLSPDKHYEIEIRAGKNAPLDLHLIETSL